MDVTKPTIGRVVYLYGSPPEKPFTAFVADIEVGGNPLTINCAALTHTGDTFLGGFQSVPHKSEVSDGRICWDWMPYQKAVASGEITPNLHAKAD